MIYTLQGRGVNDVWPKAKQFLLENHVVRPSRNGPVIEAPGPVCTTYTHPRERVLVDPIRDANPFFHFQEALWMLAGRNDVAWISQFNQNMKTYSDDGETFHGAYGYRWRHWFEMYGGGPEDDTDQLLKIIRMLKANQDERRAVLTMWDPVHDLEKPKGKDLPCNLILTFKIRQGCLHMTVCNRSNDIAFGLYGANAVHMSVLLEYMAAMVGVPVGHMHTISDSFHAYTENGVWKRCVATSESVAGGQGKVNPQLGPKEHTSEPGWPDLWVAQPYLAAQPYLHGISPYLMVTNPETWDEELLRWIESTESPRLDEEPYTNSFFPHVAQPLFLAWKHWKNKDIQMALEAVALCHASDWRLACQEWLERRQAKHTGTI